MNIGLDVKDFVGIYSNAYAKEYCNAVVDYFNNAEKAGLTLNRQQQDSGVSRLNKEDVQLYGHSEICLLGTAYLIKEFTDVFWRTVYPEYANTFAILKTYGPHSTFSFKIQKTEIGQGYHMWHSETDDREGCTRILAWTLYLNDVEEGGETEFLYYPKRIKPEAGKFIIWPAGFTHTHRGNPPISNTKYIVTGWVEF